MVVTDEPRTTPFHSRVDRRVTGRYLEYSLTRNWAEDASWGSIPEESDAPRSEFVDAADFSKATIEARIKAGNQEAERQGIAEPKRVP
jgi:hypothetical protein